MKKSFICLAALLLVFGSAAQEKFSVPEVSAESKYKNMTFQLHAITTVSIKFLKEKGISVEEYGAYMGDQFKQSWNKEAGFEGYVKGTINNLLAFADNGKVEILEQSDSMVKLKSGLIASHMKKEPKYYFTDYETYTKLYRIITERIVDHLGCKIKQTNHEDHMIIVIKKK
jgi:hypothetical protein